MDSIIRNSSVAAEARISILWVGLGGEAVFTSLSGLSGLSGFSGFSGFSVFSTSSFFFFLFFLLLGLVCILRCRVSSSDLLNLFEQPGNVHWWGFSPVWVRICLVWCSNLWNALSQ